MKKTDGIVLTFLQALGDTIEVTRVAKAINLGLNSQIKLKVSPANRGRMFLEGLLNRGGGFNGEFVEPSYVPSNLELQVDISGYLDQASNRKGINYSETMLQLAERQIGVQIRDKNFRLSRNVKSEIYFDRQKYAGDISIGIEKVKEIERKYDRKPIIWLGTTTNGSKNKIPQSCEGKENFWQELCDSLSKKVVFYELRAQNTKLIAKGIEPLESESFSFVAESEIIKASSAGIGIDGMQYHWAYALGKPKMIVLCGPTHPGAIIYPGEENSVLTIPSLEETKRYSKKCWGCGNLGYSTLNGLEESRKIMKKRFPEFEFDTETEKALASRDNVILNNSKKNCKAIKFGEHFYDCWSGLTVERVISQLEKLIQK